MSKRQIGYRIAVSLLVFSGILFFTYDTQAFWMNCSNAFFVVGIIYFFPGILTLTHATEIFESMGYLGRKVLERDVNGGFKSYAAYQAYKDSKRAVHAPKAYGKVLVYVGIFYIGLSICITVFKCTY